MNPNNIIFTTIASIILAPLANASSLTLNSLKLSNGKKDVTVTKSEVVPGGNISMFTIKFRGNSIENSKDITCNQDLTPYSPYKFVAPFDQTTNCQTSAANISQLHCPSGRFEVTLSVKGYNCEQYVDSLLNSEIHLTGSVTQEISMDDLTNVNFILK